MSDCFDERHKHTNTCIIHSSAVLSFRSADPPLFFKCDKSAFYSVSLFFERRQRARSVTHTHKHKYSARLTTSNTQHRRICRIRTTGTSLQLVFPRMSSEEAAIAVTNEVGEPPEIAELEEDVRVGTPPESPEPSTTGAPSPPLATVVPPPLSSSKLQNIADVSDTDASFFSTKKEKAVWRMIEYGVSSEQGTRKTMEDQHKAMLSTDLVTPRDRSAPRIAMGIPFFGVYDGHGGPQCAEFLRENLHTLILSHEAVRVDTATAIRDAVEEAERLFMEKCRAERIESGSTVAVALIVDETLVTGNVGDSEIVLCRAGAAKVLTVKHTLASNEAEVQRVKACGGRIFHSRVGHPKFNPMLVSLAVSRAVGDAGFKLEEYTDGRCSGLIAEPETRVTELDPQDEFFIIGCDGLWDVMSYQAAVDFCRELISNGADTQNVTEQLCQEALRLGSTDNVTALFVSLKIRPRSAGGRPASAASAQRHGTVMTKQASTTDESVADDNSPSPPHKGSTPAPAPPSL